MRPQRIPTPAEVIAGTCTMLGVPQEAVGNRMERGRFVSRARGVACVLLRELCGMSYPDAARVMGMHHATVIYHARKADRNVVDFVRVGIQEAMGGGA